MQFLATRDNDFFCSNDGTAAHKVKELQFCDGNPDCNNGSDESESCSRGKYNTFLPELLSLFYFHQNVKYQVS